MVARVQVTDIEQFSDRFCRFHGLPAGTRLRFWKKAGKGRFARNDFTVRHRTINAANLTELDDSVHVSELLSRAEKDLFLSDLGSKGLELKLYDPDGDFIYGNSTLGKVRGMLAKSNDQSDEKARRVFATLLNRLGIRIGEASRDSLYTELRVMVGDEFERALLDNYRSIASRKAPN